MAEPNTQYSFPRREHRTTYDPVDLSFYRSPPSPAPQADPMDLERTGSTSIGSDQALFTRVLRGLDPAGPWSPAIFEPDEGSRGSDDVA